MTVSELFRQLRKTSSRETADFDITQLIDKRFGKNARYSFPERELSAGERYAIERDFKRLEEGYPLQYILGEWDFYGMTLSVGEGVLIPRADTEISVETAVRLLRDNPAPVIADLCAGSGAIALAVAKEVKNSRVFAAELYDEAFGYLSKNIAALDSRKALTAVKCDVLGDLSAVLPPCLDMIISNPPYITAKEMESLPEDVRHEPKTALFGGEDGLLFYRAIAAFAAKGLKNGGYLVFEAGAGQAAAIAAIMRQNGFEDAAFEKDLNGIDRTVYTRKGGLLLGTEKA